VQCGRANGLGLRRSSSGATRDVRCDKSLGQQHRTFTNGFIHAAAAVRIMRVHVPRAVPLLTTTLKQYFCLFSVANDLTLTPEVVLEPVLSVQNRSIVVLMM